MNTYLDTTGLLIFDGPPVPNACLQAWLAQLAIPSSEGEARWGEVAASDTDLAIFGQDWAAGAVCVRLQREGESDTFRFGEEEFMQAACLALQAAGRALEPSEELDPEDLVTELAAAYGQTEFADRLLKHYSEGDELEVADQVELAMRFSGEHNLRAAMIQAGYHSDQMRLWAFGGYNDLVLRAGDGSVCTVSYSPQLDMVAGFEAFWRQRGESEAAAQSPAGQAPATQEAAKRAYIQCVSTSYYVLPPTFAAFDVTPGFLKELRRLQTLAQKEGLAEVRFEPRPGFEFTTDDASESLYEDVVLFWVVSRDGEFWIDAPGTDRQTCAVSMKALEDCFASDIPVLGMAQGKPADAGFLLDVARKMNEQVRSGERDWTQHLADVVQALTQLDPAGGDDYMELMGPASARARGESDRS